jgi:1-aminocyclopropane-1-carboxylate deaminase
MNELLSNFSSSRLHKIDDCFFSRRNIRFFLKRDDLLNVFFSKIIFGDHNMTQSVSGNKFRKMKYNLLYMQNTNIKRLLTFGGAFSNHIHATAAAGLLFGIETIGVIRGEEAANLSPTLRFARDCGMVLHFVNRTDYREKEVLMNSLKAQFGDFYYLPEGGTNDLALRGAAEIVGEIETQLDGIPPDYISVPCGTGGTIAGIISAANSATHVLGFSALKGDFLQNEVTNLLNMPQNAVYTEGVLPLISEGEKIQNPKNWSINTEFHFGGYARWTPELISFINNFKEKHNIALDPIYTGKMVFGLYKLIESGVIPPNSTVVGVHTGGIQGIEGFNQRFGNLITV